MYPTAMDIERTIEFILKSQARAEIRMEKMDGRLEGIAKLIRQGMRMLAKTDTTLAELAQAQKRTDARLAELAQNTDVRFAEVAQAQKRTDVALVELAQAQKRTDVALAELAQTQKATEKSLKAFIDSLRHGRNGRTNR